MRHALPILILALGCGPRTSAPIPVAATPPAVDRGPILPAQLLGTDWGLLTTTLVRAGDDLYWLMPEGDLRRMPITGGDPVTVANLPGADVLASGGGELFATAVDQLLRIGLDGTTTVLAEVVAGRFIVATADQLVVADYGDILVVPRAGGEPVVVVDDAGYEVVGLASDGRHVYWADGGDPGWQPSPRRRCVMPKVIIDGKTTGGGDCPPREPTLGAIHRVAIGGGADETLAGAQYTPTGLALAGDHVYWSNEDGEALQRLAVGGTVEVGLGGLGWRVAADHAGAVVWTEGGLLVEVPADGSAARVRASELSDPGTILLSDDAIFVASGSDGTIWRFPRGPARVTVVATPHGHVGGLVLVDDELVALDVDLGERPDRLIAVSPRGGRVQRRAELGAATDALTVGGGHVATYDYETRAISVDGTARFHDTEAFAMTIVGDQLYWLDESFVRSAPLAGGPPVTVYEPEMQGAVSGGRAEATMVSRDGVVYVAGQTLMGVVRIADGRGEIVVPYAQTFALAGDALVAALEDGSLVIEPGGRVLRPAGDDDLNVEVLAGDASEVWAAIGSDLVRLPLDGKPELAMPGIVVNSRVRVALDAEAAYVTSRDLDAILRIER